MLRTLAAQEIRQMKKLIAPVLSTCVCVGAVLAGSPQPSNDPTVVNSLKQLEQDMGDAMVRSDIDKLNQIYADDFATIGSSGKVTTKKDLLQDFESFHDKLVSFENGPMDVQVFGDVAVVHGSVTEKTPAVSLSGWISWRSATANGWSCAALVPG